MRLAPLLSALRHIAQHCGAPLLRTAGLIGLLFAILLGSSAQAAGEKRVALVIGNGNYTSITSLENSVSDANLIARTLGSLGFETTLITDADQSTMKRAIAEFGRTLRNADKDTVGLFYYAGHGVQNSAGENFLVPVDAYLADEADLDIMAVEARGVLAQLNSAGNVTNIVILDACRNNPFAAGTRALTRGLAPIDAPTGSFVAYSTAPGAVASDGTGTNSPFTMSLAEKIMQPGLGIEEVFREVRIEVRRKTGNAQTPFDNSSLVEGFVFNPALGATQAEAAETTLWASVGTSGDPKLIGLFLEVFPEGAFAAEAQRLMARLDPTGAIMEAAEGKITDGIVTRERPPAGAPVRFASFDAPLTSGPPDMVGRSLAELIDSFPAFTPFEGLDRAVWAAERCSGCHQWTKQTLCDQGKVIGQRPRNIIANHPHPLGGEFKVALADWAAAGCL